MLTAGDQVDVSPVMGKGFPIQRVPPEKVPNLYIFATGTGISPIKALIESGELQVKALRVMKGSDISTNFIQPTLCVYDVQVKCACV